MRETSWGAVGGRLSGRNGTPGSRQRCSSPPSGTDFGTISYVSSLSCLLYEMGEQQYRPPGATGRIQINKMDQLSGIGRDANYNKAWQQPPLRLPGQLCCCHGARVCLRTSGNTNTSQKGKHGPEVPGGQGPRSQEEGGGYHSPARQRHLPVGTPKDHPVCVPRALGSHRPPGPRDPTSQRRPGEDWARAGGARERGARGRAGTGERFLPSGARAGGAEPQAEADRGQGQPSRPPPKRAESQRRLHFDKESPPHRVAPHPLPGPRLTLSGVQVARGAHQQRGQRRQQQRGRGPPPAPGAHGSGSAGPGVSERTAPGRRAHAPGEPPGGTAPSPLPRRQPRAAGAAGEGPGSDRSGTRPRPLGIRRRGPGRGRDRRAWVPAQRPGLLALGPKGSGRRPAGAGLADRRTERRRAGGRAPGQAGRRREQGLLGP